MPRREIWKGIGADTETVNVLLIEDDEDDYILISRMLKDIRGKEFRVEWQPEYADAEQRLYNNGWDIALVDYDLGGRDGLELIRKTVQKGVKAPLVMVTGRGRYELDVEAMRVGAADYLSKNMLNSVVLERVIRHSIERSRSKEITEAIIKERTEALENALAELQTKEKELRTRNAELVQQHQTLSDQTLIHRQGVEEFPLLELVTDQEGMILEANRKADELLQHNAGSPVGKKLSLFIQASENQRFSDLLTKLSHEEALRTGWFNLAVQPNLPGGWCLAALPLKGEDTHKHRFYWLIHPSFPNP